MNNYLLIANITTLSLRKFHYFFIYTSNYSNKQYRCNYDYAHKNTDIIIMSVAYSLFPVAFPNRSVYLEAKSGS